MARRILFLNLLLLVGIAVSAWELVSAWHSFQSRRNLGAVLRTAETQTDSYQPDFAAGQGNEAAYGDFLVIADRDLFREQRRMEEVEDGEPAVEEAPAFPKRPQMQGSFEVEGETMALMLVFDTPKATGEVKRLSVGEALQGWLVSDIGETSVTLRWNEQTEVIDIFDTEAAPQKANAAKKLAAVNIVKIGSKYAAVETTTPETVEAAGQEAAGAVTPAAAIQRSLPGRRGQATAGRNPSSRRSGSPLTALGVVGMGGRPAVPQPAEPPE